MKEVESIGKLNVSEIEVLGLEVNTIRGFEKLTVNSTDLVGDLLPQSESLNSFYEPLVGYNGKYDKKANQFTSDSKRRYIVADKEFYSLTKSNMTIHSGKRSVQKQAELYILYKWHNQGNPASWPGCSFHNWGLAADMVRVDEKNVVESMKKGGWTKTVRDEGWHFECTSSSDHRAAADRIAAFRKSRSGLAYKWSEQVANFYKKGENFNERATMFNKRLEAHRQVAQDLQNDIDIFNNAVNKLAARVNEYNNDARHFNKERKRANRLYEEIMKMPNGSERTRKAREYNQLVSRLEDESNRLDGESAAIDREDNRLLREQVALDRRIKTFKKEDAWLTKESNELAKIKKEIRNHESSAKNLLSQIEKAMT